MSAMWRRGGLEMMLRRIKWYWQLSFIAAAGGGLPGHLVDCDH